MQDKKQNMKIMTKNKNKVAKEWKMYYADKKFSEFIRKRDGKCMRCGKSDRILQNSHYWARQYYSTRFDPQNCIALCAYCHVLAPDCWQDDREKQYEAFMLKRLGKAKFEALKEKHYKPKKRREAILEVMEFLS
jgi:hypothetical protein